MRRWALLLALGIVVAACGTDGDEGDVDDAAEAGEETDGEAGAGEPVSGGTFTYAAFGEIQGLDPIRNQGGASQGGVPGLALYDSLMKIGEDGEVEPHLAESLESSEDGTVWTLTLREGVEFHDGTPLDAEAVVFNLQRHLDPDNGSSHIAEVSQIADMEVTDELEAVFTLHAPWAAFPVALTDVPGMIASPTAIEEHGEDFNQNPVGAGPFMFESWAPDEELRLVKNPNYWQDGLPYLDEWVQRPIPDEQARLTNVQSGDVDAAYSLVLSAEMTAAQDNPEVEIDTFIGNGGNALTLNTQRPPLDDVRVRQALAHVIDYDAINQVRYNGQLPAHTGAFGPDSPFYSGTQYPETDPERARELLDEYLADVGEESIAIEIGVIPDRQDYAELLQGMLVEAGIEAEILMMDVAEFVPHIFGGGYDMAAWSMTHFVDPDELYSSFHSESRQNAAHFQNPEMDEALVAGRSTLDLEERKAAYQQVDEILAEQVPYIFTNPSVQSSIHRADVHGMEMYDDRQFLSHGIWLDR